MTNEIRIAKIHAERDIALANVETLKAILSNPVIELIGCFCLVELLQRYPKSQPILSQFAGGVIEAGVSGIIGIQQLAPTVPYLGQGVGETLAPIIKALPLLAAA